MKKSSDFINRELREIVHESVALLGEVIQRELGEKEFQRIERLRQEMRRFGSKGLQPELTRLRKLSPQQRRDIATAFTLMLELMNACENAFRSRQIRRRILPLSQSKPDAIIYVLTAHPTEARAPQNIWIFHLILRQLVDILERPDSRLTLSDRRELMHSLEIAWRVSIVRNRKPRVCDEAEHIYSTLLRDETLRTLLKTSEELAPVYIRSWVGGDKDGHPGVDEKTFLESLRLSRKGLIAFGSKRLSEVKDVLKVLNEAKLSSAIRTLERLLRSMTKVGSNDAKRVSQLKDMLAKTSAQYEEVTGAIHPSLQELKRLLHVFPGLVVPLEFRESSDVLISSPSGEGLAIYRMLRELKRVAGQGDPRNYVRGLIVSMASDVKHLQLAAGLVQSALGNLRLPVIPLFEQAQALRDGTAIVSAMLRDPDLSAGLHHHWHSQLEVMLGYSDSSKESGVLKSRLQVAESMHALEKLCALQKRKVTPLFFQGSGGSTDRGGGSVEEQTEWWSASALRNYKVTLQGEIVERSLATPEIIRGQLERIVQSAGRWRERSHESVRKVFPDSKVVDRFAQSVAGHYQKTLKSPDFLQVIEKATPYPYLNLLKFGSRPTKRSRGVSIGGLRAIPWILCWTQTRLLFPTWWGVGSAWEETSMSDRRRLKNAAKNHPVFCTFVRALEFTLAKVEPQIWKLYLEESALSEEIKVEEWKSFQREHARVVRFLRELLGKKDLIAWRPWLRTSISLRSPMIHPLNLLQIIAIETHDVELLRLSVTGISSGMMTTG